MINHQHIYSTLRSSLIDRDRDPSWVNHVIVVVGPDKFAVKEYVPSGALLVAYTMLFYPHFFDRAEADPNFFAYAKLWLGGENNAKYPLFANEVVAGIAVAVGVYAGFIRALPTANGLAIRPNLEHPMVRKTRELIRENGLTLEHAKQTFIELMQDEEAAADIKVADDFIANPFIAEFNISLESTLDDARKAANEIG